MSKSRHHDHTAYVASIRAKHAKKDARAELVKGAISKVGSLIGVSANHQGKAPAKEAEKNAYIASKKQKTAPSKDIEVSAPRVTPMNDYVKEKRSKTNAYAYGNQRQKTRIPYRSR